MTDGKWRSAEMVARACGGKPGAVRHVIGTLVADGLLETGKAPVAGKGRMVPVYRLKG